MTGIKEIPQDTSESAQVNSIRIANLYLQLLFQLEIPKKPSMIIS